MLLGWLFWAEGSQAVPSQHPPAMLSSGEAAPEQLGMLPTAFGTAWVAQVPVSLLFWCLDPHTGYL